MRPTDLDEVWPEVETPRTSDVLASARVQRVERVEEDASAAPLLRDDLDAVVMERLSAFLVVVLGCMTALFVQLDRLRREVRMLRAVLPRPL